MPKYLKYKSDTFDQQFTHLLTGKGQINHNVRASVTQIIADILDRQDAAIIEYTRQFDRWNIDHNSLRIDTEEMMKAESRISPEQRQALDVAAERIRRFHSRSLPVDDAYTDQQGLQLGTRWTPLDSVGIYVPGGRTAYPSSVLMNAIPAIIAGVKRIAMTVPTPDNYINPLVLAAAHRAGITEIYPIGGAQAVAALAYGTPSIAAVDKIVGPGNAYVAEAKRQVFGQVGIDMIAGPSEILIVSDAQSNPMWIAADLLSQAEHDVIAQSILIADDLEYIQSVEAAVDHHLSVMENPAVAAKSWENLGVIIHVDDVHTQAAHLVNRLAPEHLELSVDEPEKLLDDITHAGSIFLGKFTPEAIGDYIAGPNHVLPTSRSARFSSGLSVLDFMKRSTFIKCSQDSLQQVGPYAITLAETEELEAHALSIKLRLHQNIKDPA